VSVMVVVLDNSNGQRFVDGLVQLILGGKIMSAVTDLNGEVLFALSSDMLDLMNGVTPATIEVSARGHHTKSYQKLISPDLAFQSFAVPIYSLDY